MHSHHNAASIWAEFEARLTRSRTWQDQGAFADSYCGRMPTRQLHAAQGRMRGHKVTGSVQGSNAVAHVMLPGKGFSLTASGDRLIAATSTRHLLVYDVRRYCSQPDSNLQGRGHCHPFTAAASQC